MKMILCLKMKHKFSLIYLKIALHFMINEFTFSNVTLIIKPFIIKLVELYKILNNAKN